MNKLEEPRPRLREAGEAIALLGVVVSLVFIGFELRQNATAARAAAYQEMGIAISDRWFAIATDRELGAVIEEVYTSDAASISELDPSDLIAVQNHLVGVLRLWETTYLQVQLGLLEAEAMDSLGWTYLAGNPFLLVLWPQVRARVTPEFATYLESSGALDPT